MPGSISTRAFIHWLPDAPSEPTSTVVLTTPADRFVDIRVLNEALLDAEHALKLHHDHIDWAFAGTSHTTELTPGASSGSVIDTDVYAPYAFKAPASPDAHSGPYHSTWVHTIDSRTQTGEEVKDEGDMQYDARLGLTLETGQMPHPSTGKNTDYVEGWADEDISSIKNEPNCVVLEVDKPEVGVKGIFIKLGQYMQGIARAGDRVLVERHHWSQEMGWQLLLASEGSNVFPANVRTRADLRTGDHIDVQTNAEDTWRWTVIETV